MKVLHVAGSPRGKRSVSRRLAEAYLDSLDQRYTIDLDEMDVWSMVLPPFDGPALAAKYADLAGETMAEEQADAWRQIALIGSRFRSADTIVLSTPMWNFGIPYQLKHLIDAVSQRGVLFEFDAAGMKGLLAGRKVVICAARGLALGTDYPTADFDHQVAYLRTWSRMVGVEDVQVILSEATLGSHEAAATSLSDALALAARVAEKT